MQSRYFLFRKTFHTFVFFTALRYNMDERRRDELAETLNDKQPETPEKYDEAMNEMHSLAEVEAFTYSFRLGVRLVTEPFGVIRDEA